MLTIHYFARYREQLGVDREQLDWQPALTSIGALRERSGTTRPVRQW